ncbi:hypothetical protein FBU30_008482 [Linnemannia zychae]|nr:hypothetical protein FBU30_008482 [Linnemannia zychae]
MSDNNNENTAAPAGDAVQQLLASNNNGQPMSAEQRNERREALLRRQKEAREKAQQMSAAARANANAAAPSAPTTVSTATSTAVATTPTTAPVPTTSTPTPTPVTATPAPVADAPVRENMVQQAVSFLSSPSVQSAEESKKTAFLEKKGLTLKEIELARARVAGKATAPATPAAAAPVASVTQPQPQQQATYQPTGGAPPPVPPRTYIPAAQPGYAVQQQPVYIPQQQQVAADPEAFKKKLVLALLISGGVTALAGIFVQKLIYPMVRGITSARQSLATSQTEILSKLREKLMGYKNYLLSLHLGSNRALIRKAEDSEDTLATTEKDTKAVTSKKTTIEDVDENGNTKAIIKTTTTTTTTTSSATKSSATSYASTVKQLDAFSQKLETHSDQLNFERLKATRAAAQDLAEYITKETYSLSASIAYPTSRYYGYNTSAAAASGKSGGLNDPTTPESALRSEIRSLKGLLLNWRNFPVAKEVTVTPLPNLVQQQ